MESQNSGLDIWPSNQNSDSTFDVLAHVDRFKQQRALRDKAGLPYISGITWFGEPGSLSPEKVALENIQRVVRTRSFPDPADEPCEIIGDAFLYESKPAPFLLSEDVGLLIGRWCKDIGMPCPPKAFFDAFTTAHFRIIKEFFPESFLVRTQDFLNSFRRARRKAETHLKRKGKSFFTLTLDTDIAPDCDFAVEVTRVYDPNLLNDKALGTIPRPGFPVLSHQINLIASRVPDGAEILIVTDGCWSGAEVIKLSQKLRRRGLHVSTVATAMIAQEAVDEFAAYELTYFASHPYLGLDSWICQRDFIPGTPRGGVNIGKQTKEGPQALSADIGAPYLHAFRPDFFSGLNQQEYAALSLACLRLTDRLYRELEYLWGRPVLITDLARVPHLLPLEPISIRSALQDFKNRNY